MLGAGPSAVFEGARLMAAEWVFVPWRAPVEGVVVQDVDGWAGCYHGRPACVLGGGWVQACPALWMLPRSDGKSRFSGCRRKRENKWNRMHSFVLLGPILVPEKLHVEPFQRGLPWTDCEWVHPESSLIVLLEYFSYLRV